MDRLKGAPPEGPAIRVGLTTDRLKVTISADGPFLILDSATGRPAWKEQYREDVLVTTHGAVPSEGRIWRVQAAALASRGEAEGLASRLRSEIDEVVSVAYSPDRGSWRVRAGAASSREGIIPMIQKLRALGYMDAWAVDEPAAAGPAWLRLVDSSYATVALEIARARVEPVGGTILAVDGKRYRGSLELLVDHSAALRIVNSLPLESYLRGVVPAELGPSLWPELEALKAQSVAARTYAVRNLGRFVEEGFDLCDSPRCQVYEGLSGEQALSDRAVRETAGIVATYQGGPINALFTSTCGGHTEDGGEIFPEEAAPYLRGVPCYPDEQTLGRHGVVIEGTAAADAGGPPEQVHAAALLATGGIAGAEQLLARWRQQPLAEEDARALIGKTAERLGLGGKIAEGHDASSRLGFPLALAERLGWRERAEVLVDRRDLPAVLPFSDADLIRPDNTRVVAALASRGLLPAAEGGALRPGGSLLGGEALLVLQRAAAIYGIPDLTEGVLIAGGGRKLKLRRPEKEVSLAAPGHIALFLDLGGGPVPRQRVTLYPGDRIRVSSGGNSEMQYLLVLPGRKGLSDDRYSPSYSWEVSMSAVELAQKLSARLEIGDVKDLIAERRGVSGRIVSLRVVGEQGEATLNGFNVRTALGLKESLFAIDRQRGPDGKLRRVVFSGKGWGHGVGLCQMGAYGMAVRGESYRSILKHYYTGIDLARLY